HNTLRTEGVETPVVRGLAFDITERLRSEDQLREAQKFSEEIVSSAGEGIIVYDRELRYRVWNRYMESLTGLPNSLVLGQSPAKSAVGSSTRSRRGASSGRARPAASTGFRTASSMAASRRSSITCIRRTGRRCSRPAVRRSTRESRTTSNTGSSGRTVRFDGS